MRKKKQEYLHEQIIEKGYDADDFMSYIQGIKGKLPH